MGAGASSGSFTSSLVTEHHDVAFFQDETSCFDIEFDEDCVDEEGCLITAACASKLSSSEAPPNALLRLVAESLGITSTPGLCLTSNIISLNVSSNALTSFAIPPTDPPSTNLEQLNISLNPDLFASKVDLSGTANTLLFLDLSFMPVPKNNLYFALKPLNKLLYLCCDGCELDSLIITLEGETEESLLFLPVASTLQELHLADNAFSSLEALSGIERLSNLSILNLADNDCQHDSDYRKRILSKLPSLRKLDAFNTSTGNIKLNEVEGLREAVEAGDSLVGANSMEKEFDSAIKGKVDITIVG